MSKEHESNRKAWNEADQAVKYEKAWPVGSVVTALINAGLVIEAMEEHPEKYWDEFQKLPDHLRTLFPNTYSVLARKKS